MTSTSALPTKPFCLRHVYMNFCGWYDSVQDKYLHSCGDVLCPRHGVGACRQMYHRKLKALKPGWGFFTFIIFFNKKPSPDEVKAYRRLVRKAVRSWDREAMICLPLHPKKGKWHLNVGVQSKWAFKMSNRHCWGEYVNDRIAGWWDGKKMRYARGAPRRADFQAMMLKLKHQIDELCAKDVIRRPKLKRGRFRNQPKRWLWYILRCKSGWPTDELLPRKQGYRLVTGFVLRKKKVGKKAAPKPESQSAAVSSATPSVSRTLGEPHGVWKTGREVRWVHFAALAEVVTATPMTVARGPPAAA